MHEHARTALEVSHRARCKALDCAVFIFDSRDALPVALLEFAPAGSRLAGASSEGFEIFALTAVDADRMLSAPGYDPSALLAQVARSVRRVRERGHTPLLCLAGGEFLLKQIGPSAAAVH